MEILALCLIAGPIVLAGLWLATRDTRPTE